jgi:hypothetical protein
MASFRGVFAHADFGLRIQVAGDGPAPGHAQKKIRPGLDRYGLICIG